uniref:SWIM-type domain-containing protein n=1 Tax=Oreochromis aureus TaxID=47969 RepID=A0AAZ1Y394_OREAU
MRSFLPAVAEQLFRDIQKTYQETSQNAVGLQIQTALDYSAAFTKDLDVCPQKLNCRTEIEWLKFVFGSCALQALDLVDQHSVTCLTSPSGRKAFQVTGGSGRLYTCFLSCHYCPCPAFAYSVLRRNEGLVCKHILAVYLSRAMAATQQEIVSDQQMSLLLSGTMDP